MALTFDHASFIEEYNRNPEIIVKKLKQQGLCIESLVKDAYNKYNSEFNGISRCSDYYTDSFGVACSDSKMATVRVDSIYVWKIAPFKRCTPDGYEYHTNSESKVELRNCQAAKVAFDKSTMMQMGTDKMKEKGSN